MKEKNIMPTLTETEKTVIHILADNLHKPLHYVSTKKKFFSELPMDETDYLLILAGIESKFMVDIPDEIAFNFRSAKDITDYLQSQNLLPL